MSGATIAATATAASSIATSENAGAHLSVAAQPTKLAAA